MSTYLLAVSSRGEVERFAAEVAPATRELVDAERGRMATQPSRTDGVLEVSHPDSGPSGPSAPVDPDEPLTPSQQATGQHLVDVHDHLRGELERLRDVVEQVATSETDAGRARNIINQLTLRQNNWTLGAYCASYCRVVTGHHLLEDRSMFPHLRRSDPQLAPVLDRLEQEHHVIHDVLEQVDHALVQMVSGEQGTSVVREAVELLSTTLLSHLSYEERELVPALSRHGFG